MSTTIFTVAAAGAACVQDSFYGTGIAGASVQDRAWVVQPGHGCVNSICPEFLV